MPRPDRRSTNWRGDELRDRPDRYARAFSDAEIDDLISRAQSWVPGAADPGERPGPALDLAALVRSGLVEGLGFVMVSGFPLDAVPYETAASAFAAFGRLIGPLRPQNAAGHLLGHVIDTGRDAEDPTVRIYQTNQRQTFHTDGADAVGLMCMRPAAEGGASMLVSVEAAVEEMERRQPGLAKRLFEPVATDRRGEQAPGERPFFGIPVLTTAGGALTVSYQRQYIESARRFPDAPALDDEYVSALDLFDEVMNDPAMHLKVDFEPGDMQFVHNHSLLHDRTAFVDHPEPERRRHLLRVWLSLPGDRPLDPVFGDRYGTLEPGGRGGVSAGAATPTFPLHP